LGVITLTLPEGIPFAYINLKKSGTYQIIGEYHFLFYWVLSQPLRFLIRIINIASEICETP
ncbi:hypothetical protein RVS70_21200, partial [Virgibacillus sp. M23]|uniref:hypothetical protein n=1 Tax=Virgibacillus sp. M23 TaxID=3079030 RepID=UPI002A90FFB6